MGGVRIVSLMLGRFEASSGNASEVAGRGYWGMGCLRKGEEEGEELARQDGNGNANANGSSKVGDGEDGPAQRPSMQGVYHTGWTKRLSRGLSMKFGKANSASSTADFSDDGRGGPIGRDGRRSFRANIGEVSYEPTKGDLELAKLTGSVLNTGTGSLSIDRDTQREGTHQSHNRYQRQHQRRHQRHPRRFPEDFDSESEASHPHEVVPNYHEYREGHHRAAPADDANKTDADGGGAPAGSPGAASGGAAAAADGDADGPGGPGGSGGYLLPAFEHTNIDLVDKETRERVKEYLQKGQGEGSGETWSAIFSFVLFSIAYIFFIATFVRLPVNYQLSDSVQQAFKQGSVYSEIYTDGGMYYKSWNDILTLRDVSDWIQGGLGGAVFRDGSGPWGVDQAGGSGSSAATSSSGSSSSSEGAETGMDLIDPSSTSSLRCLGGCCTLSLN